MTPSTPDLFPSRSHTHALDEVAAAVRSGASCVVVTGVSGIGKTSLCRALAATGDDRTFATAMLDHRLTAVEVLAQLLTDFGLVASPAAAGHDRARLVSAVSRFLTSLKPLGARALLVIDDAERTGTDVLDTLREVSTNADAGGQLLRLVLVGQPSLEARLSEPALAALDALVGARVKLSPLEPDEILPYVAHRAEESSGQGGSGLSDARVAQVYEQSEGIPARVNFFVARPVQDVAPLPPSPPAETVATADEVPAASGPQRSRQWLLLALLVALVAVAGWVWTNRRAAPAQPNARPMPAAVEPSRRTEPATSARQSSPTPGSPDAPSPTGGSGSPGSPGQPPVPVPETASAQPPPAASSAAAPASSPASTPSPRTDVGAYRIVVASFRTAARATAVATQLQEQKLPITTRADAAGVWHQVIAGPYPTLEAARDAQRALSAAGFPDTLVALPVPAAPPSDPSPNR